MIALLDSLSIHSALSVKHTHIKEWMTLFKLQLTIKHKLINLIILTLNKLVQMCIRDRGALSGARFKEYFFANCKCDKIAEAVKEVLA